MSEPVSSHYGHGSSLIDKIANSLRDCGIELSELCAADFEPIDEFHFRGREATLQLVEQLKLTPNAKVIDIGSGLGGVARTIAEETQASVVGVDLTQEFCDAANAISKWFDLGQKTEFLQGDATNLPFPDNFFDGAVTVHVAMNIPDKTAVYKEAHRVLKSGARLVIYDIVQGDGGSVSYPTPWAMEPSISHLATPRQMTSYLLDAGFRILGEEDSTTESYTWLYERTTQPKPKKSLPVTTQILFGDAAKEMVKNQLLSLDERRMLTYRFICEA